MRILIDLQHPAHVHFFRPLIERLINVGHRVYLTGRDKDILIQLASEYGMEVEVFGRARKGFWRMALELVLRQWRLFHIVKDFNPDIIMAIAGTYVSLVGRLLRVPVYVFYDTEHANLSNLLSYPFAECVYVPCCYRKSIRWRHERYNGYHELTYLHPKYFTPDKSVLDEVGVKDGETFSIVRFVSWEAAHDFGLSGISLASKERAVSELSRFGKVFISAEGNLPSSLEEYRFPLKVSRLHHLMAFASLIFGESATMASEGAVLGVPGIYVDQVGRGYTDEQETEYGLVFNYSPLRTEAAICKAVEILEGHMSDTWRQANSRLLKDKIDVNELLMDIVLNKQSLLSEVGPGRTGRRES